MHSDSFIIAYSKIKVNHTEEHHRKQRDAEWKSPADKLRKIIYFQSNNTAKLQRVTLSPADDNRFSLSNEINHALPLAGGWGGYTAPRERARTAPNQGRNIIKSEKSARRIFTPTFREAKHIASAKPTYRVPTYRAEGISCATRSRGVTERNTFALAKVLTPSKIPKRSFVILKRGGEG